MTIKTQSYNKMQQDIFTKNHKEMKYNVPLAETLRPQCLSDFEGQDELVGKDGIIKKFIENDSVPSIIFWGPPGVGKTTLAKIISNETKSKFIQISAVTSGKKDLQNVVAQAKEIAQIFQGKKTILFIDEIHRFNKAQQDYLLPFVENGTITLIGATTENPSFEVISALLSRCRVFTLKRHSDIGMSKIIDRGIAYYKEIGGKEITFEEGAIEFLIIKSNGDPRTLLNAFEMSAELGNVISKSTLEKVFQTSSLLYDKGGEEHYNIISALHKSMRSSDANASIYWLARMLEAGEDPIYVARRMLRFASEDIGNADINAVILANAVFDACHKIGLPECKVHLAQLAIYLANAPKDNTAYTAYNKVQKDAQDTLNLPVPLHLRNAPTSLMKQLNYGKGYIYDHDVEGKKSGQQCLPDELRNRKYL